MPLGAGSRATTEVYSVAARNVCYGTKRGRGSKPIKDARNQELARSIPSIQLTRPPMRRPYFSLIVRLISVPQLSQM